MTTPAPAPSGAQLALEDVVQFADFCRECERTKVATRTQLQWWLRFRRENGLLDSGAVVEKKLNPKSKRALLFIVRPRFISWLANGQQTAA